MTALGTRHSGSGVRQPVDTVGSLLHKPITVAVLVTAVYAAYVVWRIGAMGRDPSAFVIAGPPFVDNSQTPPNLHVYPAGTIYDGMFFYRLALDPWSNAERVFGVQLDQPAYRQQRVLYPVLAWAISAGNWQLTPAALILANLLGIGVLAYASAAFALTVGRNVFASLVVPFSPGYVVSISRDLSEITEAALLVSALVLIQRRKYRLAAVALVGGMLARETLLVVPLAGVVIWTLGRRSIITRTHTPIWVWLAPIVGYATWFVVLTLRWGWRGLGQGGFQNFGAPLSGALAYFDQVVMHKQLGWQLDVLELALIGGAALACLALFRARAASGELTTVLLLSCGVYFTASVFYASYIWQDDYAWLRALHEVCLTGALALLATSLWIPRGLGAGAILAFAWAIAQRGRIP